jgi:hypothetical protein
MGGIEALEETARQAQARGVLAGRTAWLAHPLFAAARKQPEVGSQMAAMVTAASPAPSITSSPAPAT